VKGSGTGSVSGARARQNINTLTNCQGIRDRFGQRGSSSTEHQHTHSLSWNQGRVRSARFKLDRASTHSQSVKGSGTRSSAKLEHNRESINSQPVKGSGTGSVSEARARQSINTLTYYQGIRGGFGQRGSSSIEHQHQHTHPLSRDQGRVQSARLELDRASTHSLAVKGSGTGLELDRTSTHSHSVKGSGTRSVSEARARQSINTLTFCEGIRDGLGQRGSSSTEHQHTHPL